MFTSLAATPYRARTGASVLLLALAALTAVKLVFAAILPLSGDESLYWMYSRHLAPGFVDHPLINPLMIRIGTTMFGDTSLGVRFMAVMLGLPATWAVWRSAAILFRDERVGAWAAALFNLTMAMTVGALAATSDTVVILTSALLLYCLAQLNATGRGRWWLATGAAFGLGMCSKYTTVFFAVGIIGWLLLVPANRKWFSSPWTWAGGVIAIAVFSPVLLWNANHRWASFVYQNRRMAIESWSLRYVGELIGSQLLLATPPIFILGCFGLFARAKAPDDIASARVLVYALVAPIPLYFLWHSLHERVQGNWPEAVYPAFAVGAGFAATRLTGDGGIRGAVILWCRRLAAPVAIAIAGVALVQSAFALLPLGKADPASRIMAFGWVPLASEIDAIREREHLPVVVTTDYTTAGWLSFYLPSHTPVVQLAERIRWIDAPQPAVELLQGPLLYVCKNDCAWVDTYRQRFAGVDLLATLARKRNGASINTYSLYRLDRPKGAVLDPVYPVMGMAGLNE